MVGQYRRHSGCNVLYGGVVLSRRAPGLRAWVLQRITAVYLAVFLPATLVYLALWPPVNYMAWKNLVAHPWVSVLFLLACASLFLHVWVGLRDVIIDYVRPIQLRFTVLALLGFGLFASAIWVFQLITLAGQ